MCRWPLELCCIISSMVSLSLHYALMLYVGSGVLLGIGFIYTPTWFLGLFGATLFLYALKKTTSLKIVLLGGALAWWTKSLLALSLFWSVYPIKWLEVSFGNSEVFIIFVYWVTVALFLSLGGLFVAGFVWLLQKHSPSIILLGILFPFIWVGGEVLSALSFSLFTFGPGATLNTVYSLGYLGYAFGQHEYLLGLARIAGVYGLSALGALMGYGVWYVLNQYPPKKAAIVICCVLLILLGTKGDVRTLTALENPAGENTAAIIDTRFGDEWLIIENKDAYKWNQVAEAVEAALILNPSVVILPEDSRYTSPELGIAKSYNLFKFQNGNPDTILIDTSKTLLPDGTATQRAYIYDGQSKRGYVADKQYLVPQGEFMPYFYSGSLQLFGLGEVAAKLQKRFIYVPGPEKSQALLPSTSPGILFCLESADPNAVRRLVKEREVPFIVHPISHAWFHESEILWQQQDVMLKMQALWSGVDIVSAANMAKGALYTKDGKKIVPTPAASGESWQVSLVSW